MHDFGDFPDGHSPFGGPGFRCPPETLYGTTELGGIFGYGIVFKIDPDGVETVLHDFARGLDGGNPAGLAIDEDGNLYGTTSSGGSRAAEHFSS